MKYLPFFLLLIFFDFFPVSHAAIRLPRLISDGMVLQRDVEVPVWGWADPHEQITIDFDHRTYHTTATAEGTWSLKLRPIKAGGPYTMLLTGKNQIRITDILGGDVWVCSGQSNMALPVSRVKALYKDIISNSSNPAIRQFLLSRKYSLVSPFSDTESDGWLQANPKNLQEFTAVGYFFALELYKKYKIPIGLINNSWGGTPAEAWMSDDGLREFPAYLNEANRLKDSATVRSINDADRVILDAWYRHQEMNDTGRLSNGRSWADIVIDESKWKAVKMPDYWEEQGFKYVHGVVWMRKKINIDPSLVGKKATLFLGNIADQDTTYINGIKIGNTNNLNTERRYELPLSILKPGENIIAVRVLNTVRSGGFVRDKSYKIVIEDQTIDLSGEWVARIGVNEKVAPAGTLFQYKPGTMFKGMLSPLLRYAIKGVIWYQGEANAEKAPEYRSLFKTLITDWRNKWGQGDFPFLFVQLANYKQPVSVPGESSWAELREAQSMALALPRTGMAVIHDIGEAGDIHPKNKYDVGKRLALAARRVAYGDTSIIYSGPVVESVKKEGYRIAITFTHTGTGLTANGSDKLRYFTIAGPDKKYVWADAVIKDNTVLVWSDSISNPVYIRYAWADNPEGANLYNKEGLPASSFRVDVIPSK